MLSSPLAIRHWGVRTRITSSLNHPLWLLSCHLSSATTRSTSIPQPLWLAAGGGNLERAGNSIQFIWFGKVTALMLLGLCEKHWCWQRSQSVFFFPAMQKMQRQHRHERWSFVHVLRVKDNHCNIDLSGQTWYKKSKKISDMRERGELSISQSKRNLHAVLPNEPGGTAELGQQRSVLCGVWCDNKRTFFRPKGIVWHFGLLFFLTRVRWEDWYHSHTPFNN